MDYPTLNIVRQNYDSECFQCGKKSKNFTIYNCRKCDPQTVERYCFECCRKSNEKGEEEIFALCMGCAICYDYIHVTQFFIQQEEGGWQGMKYDCQYCQCCYGRANCIIGSLCCCIRGIEDEEEEKRRKKKKMKKRKKKDEERKKNIFLKK